MATRNLSIKEVYLSPFKTFQIKGLEINRVINGFRTAMCSCIKK